MRNGDGRNVDLERATLTGEASSQLIDGARKETDADAWPHMPSERDLKEGATYFDLPVVKEPVWIWSVPAYFYTGGAAGAAAFLGAALQVADRGGYDDLIVRCRRISAAGTALGTALLIHDLGRPARFMNMMRVFRPTSAMSVGSWTLAISSTSASIAALLSRRSRPARRVADVAGASGAILGLPLAGYTAVLLSDTAVPLWQAIRRSLPWLFVSAGVSAATDALLLSGVSDEDEELVERIGIVAKVTELGATALVARDADRVERVGRPLKEGVAGSLWRSAAALTAASLGVSLLPGRSRLKNATGGLLGVAGGIALRFAIFQAGKASTRDPRATFDQQRAGYGAAELQGALRASPDLPAARSSSSS